jgi:hypothetical protein
MLLAFSSKSAFQLLKDSDKSLPACRLSTCSPEVPMLLLEVNKNPQVYVPVSKDYKFSLQSCPGVESGTTSCEALTEL